MILTLSIDGCSEEKSVLLPIRYGSNSGGISKEVMTRSQKFRQDHKLKRKRRDKCAYEGAITEKSMKLCRLRLYHIDGVRLHVPLSPRYDTTIEGANMIK
tara:strand:+ start:274 stop:573 length:300 start_codon:yes stop_codon:yes gene_type:complete